MPFLFSERLPVPNLKSYCIISIVIFIASLAYGKNVFEDSLSVWDYFASILQEPFCLWALVNMAYCLLFSFGKVIQNFVLGELRAVEEQHLQDKFWNFIFYKTIFVFGVINTQTLHEVLCWVAWFSMLGFWYIIMELCKDRYEYITSSPATPRNKHVKLFTLIFCIFLSSVGLTVFAVNFGYPAGINIFTFMMAECLLLGLKSLQLLTRYFVQLTDVMPAGKWDMKAQVFYYIDLLIDLAILALDLLYHFHMILWSNVFLSMASLVLYWNIRTIFSELKRRFKKHRMFIKILKNVDTRFPMATTEELAGIEDHCAICWDTMETARKLPCGHFFHHACLCSWLQQDISCPTCRCSLSADIGIPPAVLPDNGDPLVQNELQDIVENNADDALGGLRNYFFYLDGQRIANWFPSLSIEVFHGRMGNNDQEINDMAQQLFGMFPHISREAIIEDLRHTRSTEATADNILEGHLTPATSIEAAPPVTSSVENEERPPISVDATPNNQTVNNEPSDSESAMEESSGTEDVNLERKERKYGDKKVVYPGEVRRRYQQKNTSRNQTDQMEQPNQTQESSAQHSFRDEREERRNVFLEAIGRRQTSVRPPT
ncbi:E3 ubiquitin-protein ligase AMFR-like [Hydractinia symbiolongicarpus]|uniref:E3 ubiquitin-protein ligase AMFR-like n=1 Tax=Hydractinia symbiolongicarpus TaxID=13093 RepID=UPI0025512F5A|nr:E3 ubiquitin-protein ligase AMFR-like [Hydractinia symbiolongicarpus]